MIISLVFKDRLYNYPLEKGEKITFGSGKKDTVLVPGFISEQVTVKEKNRIVSLSSKSPYKMSVENAEINSFIVLNQEEPAYVYVSDVANENDLEFELPYNGVFTVGRKSSNDIEIKNNIVSSSHFTIKVESGSIRIEDNDSTNGTYINGKRITADKIKSGDVISILGIDIEFKNNSFKFNSNNTVIHLTHHEEFHEIKHTDGAMLKYRRSPRIQDKMPTEDIILASAPNKAQKFERGRGLFNSLIGSGAMMASSMVVGAASPALLLARSAGMISPVVNAVSSGKSGKKRRKAAEEYEEQRRLKYSAYIEAQKSRIDVIAGEQKKMLNYENPSPDNCYDILANLKSQLWERMQFDRDFLDVRVGMGYEDLCVKVKSRADASGFQMESDEIKELSERIIEETRIVDNIPSRIHITDYSTVGVIGERKKILELMRNFIVSLSTMHCASDVKIVGLFEENERDFWDSLRWLPHIWDNEKQFRFLAFNEKESHKLCAVLKELINDRQKEYASSNQYIQKASPLPYYIVLFGSKKMIEKETLMNELFGDNKVSGMTSFFLFDDMYALPNLCQYIIDVDNGPCMFQKSAANQKEYFTFDNNFGDKKFDLFARRMAAVQLEGLSNEIQIPNSVTFLEGFGVKTVEELNVSGRWEKSDPINSLATPIGVLAGGKTFDLNIHEEGHGFHGLIAGGTGSGKSETLLSWILSQCVNYHPYYINFIIIDYKGGGMADSIETLPHVIGKITNISGGIERSLELLKSENNRRMSIFNEVSAKFGITKFEIKDYLKLFKEGKVHEPLPHIVIVSDEFAELKKEQPEFMKELVSVARIGRSLGIHLILATQKPGGVVNEQIDSNTNWRICLRVMNAGDSREMIKRPDAAKITQRGRAYVRVGDDDYFDMFQSFWSGAQYAPFEKEKRNSGNNVKIVRNDGFRICASKKRNASGNSGITELGAVVNYVCKTADSLGIKKLQGPCLPELPTNIVVTELISSYENMKRPEEKNNLAVPIGIYDIPAQQEQGVQYINFTQDGHYAVYGAPGTGKTNILKSIITALGILYTPKDVNIYILDCGGWSMSVFSEMPHVGGVALDCEREKYSKFAAMINDELDKRKSLFLKNLVSSYEAYRKSVSVDLPAIVIAIDNIVALKELYPDMEQFFVNLSAEGAKYGIYLIYTTSNTSGAWFKMTNNIKSAVSFELIDKGDYASVVGRAESALPKISGRAFIKKEKPVVFQAAIYSKGDSEPERINNLRKIFSEMSAGWSGPLPEPIPVMPEQVTAESMLLNYNKRTSLPVGICCDDLKTLIIDLSENYSLLISGFASSGKSELLLKLVSNISNKYPDSKIYVFDSFKKSLETLRSSALGYSDCADLSVSDILGEIIDQLNQRKKAQNEARHSCVGDFDEYEFIKNYEMITIVIDDIKYFVDSVSDSDKISMERICRLAQNLGVVVMCAGRTEDITKYNEIESLTRVIVSNQNGIALDGSPSQYPFFKNNLKYNEKDIELENDFANAFIKGKCVKLKYMK